jgi:hypothetical protein
VTKDANIEVRAGYQVGDGLGTRNDWGEKKRGIF